MKLKPVRSEVRSPLIGRGRESDLLMARRREAGDGRGQIVLLSGEAGVGKSCLLRNFESTIRSGRPTFAISRCAEFVQTPLGPLRDLLQQLDRRNSTPRDSAAHALVERVTFERNAEPTEGSPPAGAQLLHISSRTAEKHVSSALKKFNLRSRQQLGRLLTRSQAI